MRTVTSSPSQLICLHHTSLLATTVSISDIRWPPGVQLITLTKEFEGALVSSRDVVKVASLFATNY